MNGETTAGGIPHWVTSQVAGTLRTNATDYHAAWQDYVTGIINATVPNQITEGGPVIGMIRDKCCFRLQLIIACSCPSRYVVMAGVDRSIYDKPLHPIDNEYSQSGFGRAEYFQELEEAYRAGGIVVPLTYNDPGEQMNFINGTVRRR